jgi:hypothetical protein
VKKILFFITIIVFSVFIPKKIHAQSTFKVFVLAGQSNMQGQGNIYDGSNGVAGDTVATFVPSCPSNMSCNFIFNMLDGYGDGWNGWTYDIAQNGIVVATETLLSGFSDSSIITLQNGIPCFVIINSSGAYGNEVSWTFTNPSGIIESTLSVANGGIPPPNTLVDLLGNDTLGQWPILETGGAWSILNDIYLYYERGSDTIRDQITIGQGANNNMFGPELMFAFQIDQYYQEPVLIIKTAWGGKSLAEDFRPPSSGGTTGEYYNKMIDIVNHVTNNISTEFPALGTSTYELAGFAWFQGWNDGASNSFLNEYESNLYNLINDVRNDLGSPNLPVVVASTGQGGYENHTGWMQDMQDIISIAQENVACNDSIYGGTLGFVNTKPFYPAVSESPEDAGYHFHNNALTFLNIGKSIGDEMILAINNIAYCSTTSLIELTNKKQLIKIIDILGRESKDLKSQPLFYIYDDGTVEKKLILE